MTDRPRLIEVAFPLEQASIDSVHEKSVRHGHISTLHIWPARRPLAACRAALIATLLPDPGTPEKRRELCERIGGRVEKVLMRKPGPGGKSEERIVKQTRGGILHWGRETENKIDLDFFREEIRKACDGRAPRILDPFAGGGAIPLEAMRLGCEATAIDINPVAWFILKCTLEYPQKLAGQKRPLPEFVRSDRDFMEAFFKAQGLKGAMLRTQLRKLGLDGPAVATAPAAGKKSRRRASGDQPVLEGLEIEEHALEADLAWHVRAWGWWVLREARRDLARYYPVYADWQPVKDVATWRAQHPDEVRPMRLVGAREDGSPDLVSLNEDLTPDVLEAERNPRWVAKPTVAYLWARTVTCKNCRATTPLLKTRWLARKGNKRVLLTMVPNEDRTGALFGVAPDVPSVGGNNAQKREHDRKLGQGTMSRAGAWCPCCGKPDTVAMEMEDIRAEGIAGRLGSTMTVVVVDGPNGKEYRLPSEMEVQTATVPEEEVQNIFARVPFGVPDEPLPPKEALGIRVPLYGFDRWKKLFTTRQLFAIGVLLDRARQVRVVADRGGFRGDWEQAVSGLLAVSLDRQADRSSTQCRWDQGYTKIANTFTRFAFPIVWDFCEGNPFSDATGNWLSCVEWVSEFLEHAALSCVSSPGGTAVNQSVLAGAVGPFDAVVTDPPYYDAISYSDLMDFFYVWLRRSLWGLSKEIDNAFAEPLSPKWNHLENDGELTDDSSRHGGDKARSKQVYEDGMARAFAAARSALKPDGRLVVVFANKQPAAWETLVSALIRTGFTVTGSWPIRTEMSNRTRALSSAALASSVWLVCRKRPETARPGWDNVVLQEMRQNIAQKLREFWDAGIIGPDFVWAATGPAMEAFSKHPIVKKANEPGAVMSVSEFLRSVRRLVVEFVVGRVLGEASHVDARTAESAAASLDDVTTYYLLHRHDFGMDDAPAGACILYAISCSLSEHELADRYDLLARTGGVQRPEDEDDELDEAGEADEEEAPEGTGSTFKLKNWKHRRGSNLGLDRVAERARVRRERDDALGGRLFESGPGDSTTQTRSRVVPLIDMIHHLMHLWVEGDVTKVNDYVDSQGLRRSEVFRQLLQALIELSTEGGEERRVLEAVSNHLHARGQTPESLLDDLEK
jgi:adenine-specific DNA methylase